MKKYNVELPKKNKLGKIGHIFIEVKIANELYTTIKNALDRKYDFKKGHSFVTFYEQMLYFCGKFHRIWRQNSRHDKLL